MKKLLENKTVGKYISAAITVATIVFLIVYLVYASGLKMVNTTIVLYMVLIVVINAAYFTINKKFSIDYMGILEIGATVLTAVCAVTFLKDNMNSLADLLNGIALFLGGTGSVTMIFTILGAILVIGVAEIVVCFMKSEYPVNQKGIAVE